MTSRLKKQRPPGRLRNRSRGGRPSKYQGAMPSKVIELMKKGASKAEVSANLGISRETLHQWENDPGKSEFSDAIKRGEELSRAWWMQQGRENLQNKNFSPVLWYMNMKNRFGWRDKWELEHSGPDGGPIELAAVKVAQEISEMTPEQRAEKLKELQERNADGD